MELARYHLLLRLLSLLLNIVKSLCTKSASISAVSSERVFAYTLHNKRKSIVC